MFFPITMLVPSHEKLIRGRIVTVAELSENSILFVNTYLVDSISYVPKSRCVIVRTGR